MSMKPKDGIRVNLFLQREVKERLDVYAEEHGQTMTASIERILTEAFDKEDAAKKKGGSKK